ncbi:MAG: SDR family NAD(P)-dependent oxidoreductase, partial [Polyangiaceae bacterium]
MERVAVFGASSAIAGEVACLYARRGARLHLVGRNEGKLAATAGRCAGAEVTTEVADFARLDDNASV